MTKPTTRSELEQRVATAREALQLAFDAALASPNDEAWAADHLAKHVIAHDMALLCLANFDNPKA